PEDRMMRRPKMRARVLVRRVVATADVPAAKAQPQMHPAVAGAQALFAAVGARRHGTNLIEMRATIHWRFPVLSIFYWSARGRYSSDATTVALSRRRSEEHTSELQSRFDLVCRLLLEKKKN